MEGSSVTHPDRVAAAIAAGHCTRPAIALQVGLTEKQVQSALEALSYQGRAKVQHRQAGRHKGRAPGLYSLVTMRTPATASVFQVAA